MILAQLDEPAKRADNSCLRLVAMGEIETDSVCPQPLAGFYRQLRVHNLAIRLADKDRMCVHPKFFNGPAHPNRIVGFTIANDIDNKPPLRDKVNSPEDGGITPLQMGSVERPDMHGNNKHKVGPGRSVMASPGRLLK